LVNGADGSIAWRSCSAAAANCKTGQYRGDSLTWFKKEDPSKDCFWVNQFSESRCLSKDDDAVFAFEKCRESCGGSGAVCEDSNSWHKRGDPSKNCDWAARLSRRFLVTGEDDTLAYQACRKAARNCDF
jgi:hypothetical protein